MAASPRRRRTILTLGQLKGRLSAGIEYATKLVEDESLDHELRLKGVNALVQAAIDLRAHGRSCTSCSGRCSTLEQHASDNGHHEA